MENSENLKTQIINDLRGKLNDIEVFPTNEVTPDTESRRFGSKSYKKFLKEFKKVIQELKVKEVYIYAVGTILTEDGLEYVVRSSYSKTSEFECVKLTSSYVKVDDTTFKPFKEFVFRVDKEEVEDIIAKLGKGSFDRKLLEKFHKELER